MVSMSATGSNEPAFRLYNTAGCGPQATNLSRSLRSDTQKMLLSPEIFIGLELSIVPQVQQVFVERIDRGKTMRVMVMLEGRDAEVRRRVYAREQAIIDEHPQFDFDFYTHQLMGRKPATVVDGIGKLAYKRFIA